MDTKLNNQSIFLVTLAVLSLFIGIAVVVLYFNDLEVSAGFNGLWQFVIVVLLVMWVNEDSKNNKKIYKPFDFGFLVFLFYIIYFPYYLIKTRGWLLGSGIIVGIFLLLNISPILVWVLSAFSHNA